MAAAVTGGHLATTAWLMQKLMRGTTRPGVPNNFFCFQARASDI